MKIIFLYFLLCISVIHINAQAVIDQKGTRIIIDSSKWKFSGNNIYNKNTGNLGIGTANPTAQLHTTGNLRHEGIGVNTINTKILTADASGNITTRLLSNLLSGSTITSINGLANSSQTFGNGTTGSDFNINSVGSVHTFNLPTASSTSRGALSSTDWSIFNAKENALTFSNGLTRSTNTISVNTSQNINTLSNLISNGLIKTSGGTGALSIATLGTDYSSGTSSLATGILKSTTATGALSIAVAGDFPILNQNTSGNAATVTTNANLTGPITSVGNATSISSNVITNDMLSQVSSQVFKGRTSAGTGNVEDITSSQATAMLNTFTSSEKGLVPASGGGTTSFLRADGTFATPVGFSNRNIVSLSSDVVNSNPVANTLADVTGLSFSVTAGILYHFYAIIPYTSASPSNGSRWTIDAPASILLNYVSRNTLTPTTETVNYANAVNIPAASNNTSSVSGNLAIIEGLIKSSVNGTLQIKFASETASTAITAKAGASLEYW